MEALAPEQRLAGRYVLDELVATGGMAAVWRATDEVLARPVAVKILRPDLAHDPGFSQRFQTEAVAAARLTHPNIVHVFDTGVDGEVHYIVMEYVKGMPLRQLLTERGPLDGPEAVRIIGPVLAGLGFAHAQGVLHRDIKPGNILVGDDGRVKVVDFGIAKAAFAAHDLTRTGAVLGTVRYVSPEQVQAGTVDGRSDLYSVGVVLYEMLTGRAPFVAETEVATAMMRLTQRPAPLRSIRPSIPRGVEAVVLRSLALHPDDRYPTAEAMRASLERQVGAGEPTPAFGTPPVAVPRRDVPARTRRLVPVMVAAVVLLAVAIVALLARGGSAPKPAASATGGASSPGASSVQRLDIASAKDDDPQGDHTEHPTEVGFAIDGNPATAWSTDHYRTAAFGNLKNGLGLWVALGHEATLSRVTIHSSIPGWRFELESGSIASPSSPLPATSGATTFDVGPDRSATVDLRPVRTSGLLIWITSLGPDQGAYAASIAEVSVYGTR